MSVAKLVIRKVPPLEDVAELGNAFRLRQLTNKLGDTVNLASTQALISRRSMPAKALAERKAVVAIRLTSGHPRNDSRRIIPSGLD